MRSRLAWALKLFVSCALLIYLGTRVDLERLIGIVGHIDGRLLIVPVAAWVLGLAIGALRWAMLLRVYGLVLPYGKVLRLCWLGAFFNNLLPSSIGSDAYKFITLNRQLPGRKSVLFCSLLLDRGLGVLALVISVVCLGLLNQTSASESWWNMAALALGIVGLLVTFVLMGRSQEPQLDEDESLVRRAVRLIRVFLSFSSRSVMAVAILLSLCLVLLNVLSVYVIFLSFGLHPPLAVVGYLQPMINLLGLLPVSLGNFGLAEGAGYVLYPLHGVAGEGALLVYFVSNVLLVLCSLSGGVVLLGKAQRWARS